MIEIEEVVKKPNSFGTPKTVSVIGCNPNSGIAGVPMKEFVIDSKKEYDTTSVHGIVNIPGIYNVTVTFDRPSQDSPTTAIKEFRYLQ